MGQTINWAGNTVTCIYTQYVSLGDIMRALTEVNTDKRLSSQSHLIHDFSNALHIDPGVAALITLAGHTLGGEREKLTVKTAVVSADPNFITMVRAFEKQSIRQLRCFTHMEHARLWLGLTES